MRLKAILTVLVAALCGFSPNGFAGKQSKYELARDLDPLRNETPRPKLKGSFQSPFKIQVDEGCMTLARDSEKKHSLQETVTAFENLFTHVFDSVVECGKSYSELAPYLDRWITQFRRSVVVCKKQKSGKGDPQGTMYDSAFTMSGALGDEFPKHFDLPPEDSRPLARILKPTYVIASNILENIVSTNGADIGALSLTIHEILHATEANNQYRHGEVEDTPFDEGEPCRISQIHDRVVLISRLCGKDTMKSGFGIPRILFEKTNRCGVSRACLKTMTGRTKAESRILDFFDGVWDREWFPSKGLPKSDAESFCRKIYRAGACEEVRKGEDGKTYTANNPALNRFGDEFRRSLLLMFPQEPLAITKAFREIAEVSMTRNRCFDDVFDAAGHDDDWTVKNSRGAMTAKDPTAKTRFERALELIQENIRASEACRTIDLIPLKLALSKIKRTGEAFFNSALFLRLIEPRMLHKSEFGWADLSDRSDPVLNRFREYLGEDRLKEYISALKRHHYNSLIFDCEAAGFSTVENKLEYLKILENGGPSRP